MHLTVPDDLVQVLLLLLEVAVILPERLQGPGHELACVATPVAVVWELGAKHLAEHHSGREAKLGRGKGKAA